MGKDEEARELERRALAGDLGAALELESLNDERLGPRKGWGLIQRTEIKTELGTLWARIMGPKTLYAWLEPHGERTPGWRPIVLLGVPLGGYVEYAILQGGRRISLRRAVLSRLTGPRVSESLPGGEEERIAAILDEHIRRDLARWLSESRDAAGDSAAQSLHDRIVRLREQAAGYRRHLAAKEEELAKALVLELRRGGRRR